MFYEKDEINELLKCPNCNERLEEPCMLPCGHSVCARCTSSDYWFVLPPVDEDNNGDGDNNNEHSASHQLVCNACLEVHRIPAAGFPTNKVLLKLVETKPHDVYRSKAVERLKTSLRAIRARKIDLLDALLDANKQPDFGERIREQCGSVRAAVQLAGKQLVARIDECLERRMHEIERAFAETSHATEQVAALRERIDKLVADCAEKEEQSNLDDERVAEEANAIRDELDRLRAQLAAQWNSALALHFVESPTIRSNNEILGKLTIGSRSAEAEQKQPTAADKATHATTKATRRPLLATPAKRQGRVERPNIKKKPTLTASLSAEVKNTRTYSQIGKVLFDINGGGGDDQFCRPWGVCCDKQGNIIISDRSNDRIQVFDKCGQFVHKFGTYGTRAGQFARPAGVAFDNQLDRIVVADKDNHRIQVFQADGTFLFKFGEKGSKPGPYFNYPWDVAVSGESNIIVSDWSNYRIQLFNSSGQFVNKYCFDGLPCKTQLDSPRGVAFNHLNQIIVTDFKKHRLLVINADLQEAKYFGAKGTKNGHFLRPQGCAVDHEGNIIVADSRNFRVQIFSPNGLFKCKFGSRGSGPDQMDGLSGVCVTPDGIILVVDSGNNRVLAL